MSVWKKQIAYVVLIVLIGYTVGISALAMTTGEIRDRYSFVKYSESPLGFVFSLAGTVIFSIVLIFILYLLYSHERYVVSISNRIWKSYQKLTGSRPWR